MLGTEGGEGRKEVNRGTVWTKKPQSAGSSKSELRGLAVWDM
jgi:hypothetical protein